MQRGKTLSDNDAAARARNRQEEESLSVRLKHLELEQEHLHSTIEKERKTLLQTSRTTRRNSGCSPVVVPLRRRSSTSAIVSTHFRKPWALTTSETSHNVVYNDDLDSYRCRRASLQVPRPRTRCASILRSTRAGCASAPPGERQRSKSLVLPRPFTAYRRRNSPGSLQLEMVDDSVRTLVSDMEDVDNGHSSYGAQTCEPEIKYYKDTQNHKPEEKSQKRKLAWNVENVVLMTKNKLDSSSVDIYQNVNTCHTVDDQICISSEEKPDTSGNANAYKDQYVNNNQALLFKGKKIHHYVKPQDRYKRDPFKEVRQEKLLRKLSIENPIFLNGTRGSINIQTTFPRAARDRALRRLVEDNQEEIAASRKPRVNSVDLQRRVREFCTS